MTPPPVTTPHGEVALTRYRIFKTEDGGNTLVYVGAHDAKSSEAALREFLPPDTVGVYVAVNENSIKLRNLKERPGPVIETEPIPWPTPTPRSATEPAAA